MTRWAFRRPWSSTSLRHSYVSHLTEDGVDRRFIQVNVGHETDSSTAIYTHVSSDFMNTALRKALAPALEARTGRGGWLMAARLDYRWHLRQVMADAGHVLHHRPDRRRWPTGRSGCRPARSTGWSTERPERLSLKILMALLDILDCTMDDLIEPVPAAGTATKKKASAAGGGAGVGDLRPRRARITRPGE